MKALLKKIIRSLGYEIQPLARRTLNMEPEFLELYARCKPFTMTSPERMHALYQAVRHVVKMKLAGDFVECGVWRGGSCMMIAHTLLKMGATDRQIRLFDTFEGMSKPTDHDRNVNGVVAEEKWQVTDAGREWCAASLEDVRHNMEGTGYPMANVSFVQGKVEDTLPASAPAAIALLRLDTDWYESTRQELDSLYPRLCPNGVLILDDYGHWTGSKKAVDEYFLANPDPLLFNRIVNAGRIAIKHT